MSGVNAVQEALLAWLPEVDPDSRLVVMFDPMELATLHLLLAELQEKIEDAPRRADELVTLGAIRKRVEAALSQAGYGGDPRP